MTGHGLISSFSFLPFTVLSSPSSNLRLIHAGTIKSDGNRQKLTAEEIHRRRVQELKESMRRDMIEQRKKELEKRREAR
ncbi:hypothetical protein BT96DRAFT_353091 [Gymnopus androsaceus JB14]|uniref:Uncharacterized protein n=1 Tax=Gymnopus androsaceus JB14 TaxID=1447944 RepID=A0A6A4GYV6_9AGAR|nr:hypothetical protein BT96DRAFT_353091 [Gymnopus androsaceus JB14]